MSHAEHFVDCVLPKLFKNIHLVPHREHTVQILESLTGYVRTGNISLYLLTPWSRVPLEKLTSLHS
jgi:hypothetical protein